MVLNGPDLIKAQFVSQPYLFERVHVHLALGLSIPGPRDG
jgi:hypothetical protein